MFLEMERNHVPTRETRTDAVKESDQRTYHALSNPFSSSARTASGSGELHKRLQDNLFVVSGEATEIIGGQLIDPRETAPDEIRATRVEGGESHLMRKGDVLHVPANTPHQTVLAPGATFVYYVVKVEEPTVHMMPAAK